MLKIRQMGCKERIQNNQTEWLYSIKNDKKILNSTKPKGIAQQNNLKSIQKRTNKQTNKQTNKMDEKRVCKLIQFITHSILDKRIW